MRQSNATRSRIGRRAAASAADSSEGFTVLELMVGLAILAIGLAALSGSVADSLFRTTRAENQARAVRTADALLARLGVDIAIREGEQSGQTDAIDWDMSIRPYGTDEDRASWAVRPEEVTLTLAWREAGHRTIAAWRTLRPMPVPPWSP